MTNENSPVYYQRNREGLAAYNLPSRLWVRRLPGMSAMLRIKNEKESIAWCLESIKDLFDEIVIAFQNSNDRSEEIVIAASLPNVRIFHYPFDSFPNGPGHDSFPADSVRSRAYFYNWTLAKTTRAWVCKWDGDMVAMDGVKDLFNAHLSSVDVVSFHGVNLIGEGLKNYAHKAFTATEPRLFRVTPHTFYYPGTTCERFNYSSKTDRSHEPCRLLELDEPAFVHLKWNKPESSIVQAWPKDWREKEHFQNLMLRGGVGDAYSGPYPSVLRNHVVFPARKQ